RQQERAPYGLGGHYEDPRRPVPGSRHDRSHHEGQRAHQRHGQHGRGERRRDGDDGAQGGDLAHGAGPPTRVGLGAERLHFGRPGQAGHDEGQGGVGHQAVPPTVAQGG